MGILELLLLAVGLSMDAFAVSVCKGLALKKLNIKSILTCGVWFGFFQGMMPMIGYLLGVSFANKIEMISSWIAFILLALIGANMIKESFSKEEDEESDSLDFKTMLLLAIATSIDALAVGITFVCVPVKVINASQLSNTFLGVIIIGITTFLISSVGVKIGNVFGLKYKNKAEFAGGFVLVCIGLKIIIQHLFF